MSKSKSFVDYLPLFNFIIILAPLSTFLTNNSELFNQPDKSKLFLIFMAFIMMGLLSFFFYKWKKSISKNIIFYFGFNLLFFWPVLTKYLGHSGIRALILFFVTYIIILCLLLKLTKDQDKSIIFLKIISIFSVIPFLQAAFYFVLSFSHGESKIKKAEKKYTTSAPNIYFIVFDTMSSLNYFGKQFPEVDKKKLSNFKSFLKNNDYTYHPDAWSNYARTDASMSGAYNFEYHKGGFYDPKLPYQYFTFLNSKFFNLIKEKNYEIISRDVNSHCPSQIDHCYKFPQDNRYLSFLFTSTPFYSILVKADQYINNKAIRSIISNITAPLQSKKNLEPKYFIDYLKSKPQSSHSQFIHAHFFGAHPPNFLNENCQSEGLNLNKQHSGEGLNTGGLNNLFKRDKFRNEYLCYLQDIKEIINLIKSQDPNGWVVMTSDHGHGVQKYGLTSKKPWEQDRLESSFHILQLTKLPKDCTEKFKERPTLINRMRAFHNCINPEKTLEMLDDKLDTFDTFTKDESFFIPKITNDQY